MHSSDEVEDDDDAVSPRRRARDPSAPVNVAPADPAAPVEGDPSTLTPLPPPVDNTSQSLAPVTPLVSPAADTQSRRRRAAPTTSQSKARSEGSSTTPSSTSQDRKRASKAASTATPRRGVDRDTAVVVPPPPPLTLTGLPLTSSGAVDGRRLPDLSLHRGVLMSTTLR